MTMKAKLTHDQNGRVAIETSGVSAVALSENEMDKVAGGYNKITFSGVLISSYTSEKPQENGIIAVLTGL